MFLTRNNRTRDFLHFDFISPALILQGVIKMKFTPEVVAALEVLRAAAENDFERHRIDVLERDLTAPPAVEVLDDKHQCFDGLKFTAQKSGHFSAGGLMIHRLIWTYCVGDIPKGYEIHHIDKNKSNNSVDNLQCLSKSDHQKIHANEEKQPRRGKQMTFVCSVCGKEYVGYRRTKNCFCSRACRNKHARTTLTEMRTCPICGKRFETYKHGTTKCCSLSCGNKLRWQHA